MKPQTQLKVSFVFLGIWTAMGGWALVNYLSDPTAATLAGFLLNMGVVAIWLIWSILQIRDSRRKRREEKMAKQTTEQK